MMGFMKQSKIDSFLVQYAGIRSAADIGEMVGYSAEEVARRTQQILDSVVLTNAQRRAKLIFQLDEISAEMTARYKTARDEDLARLGTASAGAIGKVLAELRAMEKDAREDQEEQKLSTARILASMTDKAIDRAIGELKKRHPEISREELGVLVETNLVEVAREMDAG